MCLATPGKIVEIINSETAAVDFNGLKRNVNISLVSANVNDYVVVHAGFAIGILNQQDAQEINSLLSSS